MLAALLLACSWGPKAPDGVPLPGVRPDVVVVTLDTTRADRIGAYGYAGAQTEAIDALAKRGALFRNAYSPLPLTIPAHATLFTGLLPFHHQIRSNGDNVLAASHQTLAELLKAQGWRTAASVAAFVTSRQWGFSQGFDAYFDALPEESAEGAPGGNKNFWHHERAGREVVDDALGWLAGQPADQPVFLWVHLYDAHFPYEAHAEFGETFKDRPYDGELAYVDDQVQRLVGAFEGREVLWALVADHGEGLGEHREASHGLFAYNPTAHVPFILSGAGVKAGVYDEAVSTADLTPSLLKILGVPIPAGLDGVPQPGTPTTPYVESYQLSERFGLAPHRAVVSEGFKLIATPRPELYDQAGDPSEKDDVAAEKPEVVARLLKLLEEKNAGPPIATTSVMDADTLGQLAALGYVSGGGSAGLDFAALPDPKDKAEALGKVNRLDVLAKNKGPEEALAALDEVIPEFPRAFELRMRKITLLGKLKRQGEIKAELEKIASDFPDKSRPWIILAAMALQERDPASALPYAERALSIEPAGVATQEAVVEALFAIGQVEDAVTRGEAFMVQNPANYGVAALLGRHFLLKADFAKSEQYLRVAVNGPNPRRAARSQLAVLAAAAGARADALKLLEEEIADYPGNLFARKLLAKFYGEEERWLDEKLQLEAMRAIRKEDVVLIVAIAQCDFNLKDFKLARKTLSEAMLLAPDNPDVLLLHANLLAKEGKRDEGAEVFKRAQALKEAEVKAAAAEDAAAKEKGKEKGAAAGQARQRGKRRAGGAPRGAAGEKGASP